MLQPYFPKGSRQNKSQNSQCSLGVYARMSVDVLKYSSCVRMRHQSNLIIRARIASHITLLLCSDSFMYLHYI